MGFAGVHSQQHQRQAQSLIVARIGKDRKVKLYSDYKMNSIKGKIRAWLLDGGVVIKELVLDMEYAWPQGCHLKSIAEVRHIRDSAESTAMQAPRCKLKLFI